MITDSIVHVFGSILQYIALVFALMLYFWIKDVFPLLRLIPRASNPSHRDFRSRSTRALIHDELFILYQWVRQLRRKYNLTQEEMAEKLGVDPRTVQRWERGVTQPQPRHYRQFLLMTEDRDRLASKHMPPPAKRARSVRRVPAQPYPWIFACGFLASLLTLIALVALLIILVLHFWLHII